MLLKKLKQTSSCINRAFILALKLTLDISLSRFRYKDTTERDAAFDKVLKAMKENYGTIYRSKGDL